MGSAVAHLYARLLSNQTDVKPTTQLVKHVIDKKDDPTIWISVYELIRQTQPAVPIFAFPTAPASATLPITPKRTPSTTSVQQTPNTRTTSVMVNSSE